MRALLGMLVVVSGACGYSEFDDSSTLFKCDPQNPCPADQFCSNSPAGVCVPNGTLGCLDQPLSRNWGFDTPETIDNWQFNIDSDSGVTGLSRTWRGDMGNPQNGAFELQLFGTETMYRRLGWFRHYDEYGDLRGKIISARAWTDSPDAKIKVYVQTEADGGGWSDGGLNFLTKDDWDCFSLNMDAPYYKAADHDPSMIEGMGFELWGTSPATIIIDDVGY